VRSKGRTAAPGYNTSSKKHDETRIRTSLLVNDTSLLSRALITPMVVSARKSVKLPLARSNGPGRKVAWMRWDTWVHVGHETLITVRSWERRVDETEAKGVQCAVED